MNNAIEERLTELEIRFAHMGRLVDELNEVVADCNLRIDQLARENRNLKDMVRSLADPAEESPDE